MICYIQNSLATRPTAEDDPMVDFLHENLRNFGVRYKTVNCAEEYFYLVILEQKITLDEFQMQKFFQYVVEGFIPLTEINYVNLGHEDFCIELREKREDYCPYCYED